MPSLFRSVIALLTVVALCAGGCATTGSADSRKGDRSFSNFLVIGVAGDYDSRAQFERMIVSEIRRRGATASTYHSKIGGNKPLVKEDVLSVVQAGNFDAVLAVRNLDTDVNLKVKKSRTEIDATPIGGRIINLFRSEYTDYENPGTLDLAARVVLAIELYDSSNEEIVWSMEHTTKSETNLGLLIDETAAMIVKNLDRERLISQ